VIITKTPFRITLGGGGTDLPSYYQKHGGMVLTMAINKHVYITLKPDDFEEQLKLRYSEIEVVKRPSELRNTRAREVLTAHDVVNVEINTCSDLSTKSGLGSSGSFLVGLIRAIREYKSEPIDKGVIAEEACDVEINRLMEPVGKQDQYIASFGGVRLLNIDQSGNVTVESFEFDIKTLIDMMHVYSLNQVRNASEVLCDQNDASAKTQLILSEIKEYGYKTCEYLRAGGFDKYGLLLNDYWNLKRQLSSKISLPWVDELYDIVRAKLGVLGGKIIGAGGGGFLLLCADKCKNELDDYMRAHGCKRLYYNVDAQGSRTIGNYI
jgi:D-glycero-alpha-D-manno-heptose-7-phosphate kinase